MIVFAVGMTALMLAGMIAVLIWRDVDHSRREDRLINLLVARSPQDFAVLQRAVDRPATLPAPPATEQAAPEFIVGLS